MGTVHEVSPTTTVSAADAEQIARVMGALATGSRIRILASLRAQARTVGELTEGLGMGQPAVSHQLRILRDLDLVIGTRTGRNVLYGLHDSHVAALVDEALRHMEHLRSSVPARADQSNQSEPIPDREVTR